MKIQKVNAQAAIKAFHDVPFHINASDPNWIAPLRKDIEKVFNPQKNPLFKDGDAQRWILYQDGQLAGRIAAFLHPKLLKKEGLKTGGIGFFECQNDQMAADALFHTAEDWLQARGIKAVEGPINFGEKDRFWGLLIDGFYPPTYGMNYNPAYYSQLFESNGFEPFYYQYTYYRKVEDPLPEKYKERAAKIANDPNYEFGHLDKKNLGQYAEAFRQVYNRAWAERPDFKPMEKEQANHLIESLRPVLVADLVWFGYYKQEPVSFFIAMPELNEIFKHFNGRFGLLEKIRFKWHEWRKTCRTMFGVAFGIDPGHRSIGLEGALINTAAEHLQPQNRWEDLELTWIGDFNPKMQKIVESLGAYPIKTHVTYRKLIEG